MNTNTNGEEGSDTTSGQAAVFNIGDGQDFLSLPEECGDHSRDSPLLHDNHARPETPTDGLHHKAKPESQEKMLVELYDLQLGEGGETEWQETARWIKYEEDVEGISHHWGRPHVAFLELKSLIQLRKCLAQGVVLLDLDVKSFKEVCQRIALVMKQSYQMDDEHFHTVLDLLQKKHKYVYKTQIMRRIPTLGANMNISDPIKPRDGTFIRHHSLTTKAHAEVGLPLITDGEVLSSGTTTPSRPRGLSFTSGKSSTFGQRLNTSRYNIHGVGTKPSVLSLASIAGIPVEWETAQLMRKVPAEAEAAQVFVGELSQLRRTKFAMVRLLQPTYMSDIIEAPIPIRFLFVVLGPKQFDVDYHELGRSIATLMSNPHFHDIAYRAETRNDMVAAIDDFLDESLVIPPGEIDHKELLSVEGIRKAVQRRKMKRDEMMKKKPEAQADTLANPLSVPASKSAASKSPFRRTGKLFAGVIRDIRTRFPYYWSDFRDALNFQCFTSIIFMFFAAFAPAITFGGLMGTYTKDVMGISETLLAQSLCGILWGLFAAQPLLVMSATGPVLIFEYSLFQFCNSLSLDFLIIRVWVGIYVLIITLITVMLEGSFLVQYVTRFTEDIFTVLISVIYIGEGIKFLQKTFRENPVMDIDYYSSKYDSCLASYLETNSSSSGAAGTDEAYALLDSVSLGLDALNQSLRDTNVPANASHAMLELGASLLQLDNPAGAVNLTLKAQQVCMRENQPDTGLLTANLTIATFILAFFLKQLRQSHYLGRTLRKLVSDFSVLIAIIVVGVMHAAIFPRSYAQKLDMPSNFGYTDPAKRGYRILVPFLLPPEQWIGYIFALICAFLIYILIFVEIEIIELLLAKKDRGLKKGTGFHWDLLLMGILTLLCSVLGFPWMCAAVVQSVAHGNSLTVMKRHAPGERPAVDYVIEQRVTTICVALLIGACTFAGDLLRQLPVAVLFGVFIYLGVMNLIGVQFISRIFLFFIPEKYFPDFPYCQQVRMWRMHLYTILQFAALAIIYVVKFFRLSSLLFPFVLMIMALIRKFLFPRIFSDEELHGLDGPDEEHESEEYDVDLFSDIHTVRSLS